VEYKWFCRILYNFLRHSSLRHYLKAQNLTRTMSKTVLVLQDFLALSLAQSCFKFYSDFSRIAWQINNLRLSGYYSQLH